MKKQFRAVSQPHPAEIQPLLGLLNAGRWAQAESAAQALLGRHPQAPTLHNFLGVAQERQGRFEAAAASYRKALAGDPRAAEIHFNLGVVLAHLQRWDEAIASYRRAANLNPRLAEAHFNLGIALQQLGRLDEAAASYRQAVRAQPGFFEAHGALGTVLQRQGRLAEAVASYEKALAIQPDARGHFNLATALSNQGNLDQAIAHFRDAIALHPGFAEAYANLGEALWHQGEANEAIATFRQALAIDPDNALANYNLGVFLYDAGELEQAIPHFERSRRADWRERVLYCLYKSGRFQEFRERLDPLLEERHLSPFLATLSGHYATNFGEPDPYNFCRQPLDFVHHRRIEPLAAPGSELLRDLLRDITHAEIARRMQGRLHHGIQSAGNLFKRPEPSFRTLAGLIRKEVEDFRAHFAGADCEFIRAFPREIEFASSWYVKMRQGGHLDSHIHEEGWISGAVYLAIPQNKRHPQEGAIELSTHGDDYPRRHPDFPTKTIAPKPGEVVFFPSSVFHRTIPFSSDEERICIAFDVKPRG